MPYNAAGYTLVELMIALVISVLVIAASTTLFAQLFTQFKQESRVAQTDIGSALGLDYMRKDIQSAGYGLPWMLGAGVSYNEYSGPIANATNCNDSPSNPPRAIVPLAGAGQFGSDYLAIKSMSVAVNDSAAGKSTTLQVGGVPKTWNPNVACTNATSEDLCPSDQVIVVSTLSNSVTLVTSGGKFSPMYNGVANYAPIANTATNIIYGVTSASLKNGLRMPFNRADYFIAPPSVAAVPGRCAPNTGELVKAVVNQAAGSFTYYPILDCVADMKVSFQLTGGALVSAGVVQTCNGVVPCNAAWIRQNVMEVRVFMLTQEGQIEPSYTSPGTIYVGDPGIGDSHNIVANNQSNYRWKIYTIMEKPFNLRPGTE